MKHLKVHVGMRTIKTAIVVMAVLLVYHFIDRPAAVPALAAVFALREDWSNTIQFAKIRLVSNSVGGFFSLLYYLIREFSHHNTWMPIIIIPIFVVCTIVILNAINCSLGVIGGLAALLLISLTIPMDATIDYVFLRILDTFVGVLFAIAINRFGIPEDETN
ncbi:hypothetical protein FPFC_041330 [Fructobacillus pseudoficulneus]|uniref:Aromatic acid exporter family member 1 n=1 Tax=Fructobacillus pseudoficulneus TaxID=220714 RepID=A0A3F3H5H7_9LACO|nr:aromatic acid exporter family protein [Fructobacillus pseudoficulneus]GAP03140.1 hypothetical protein FPFC_041330 [Fructobacillus pseudoficulneus]SEH41113.1 Fusaric acid resistance protein-like [Fructobacillus pseudoficulneus]